MKSHPADELWCRFTLASVVQDVLRETPKNCVAIGVNCFDPLFAGDLVKTLRKAIGPNSSSIRTLCYPNSGKMWNQDKQCWEFEENRRLSPREWAKVVAGSDADLCGGCCQTTSEHISELARAISSRE
mmetsp:Transcript_7024/g.21386  ORF Transcript_7024/g.21386 Transcript_7024/m.21386 type:complete len:128 (+) Transcript_7024:656-1039(+)